MMEKKVLIQIINIGLLSKCSSGGFQQNSLMQREFDEFISLLSQVEGALNPSIHHGERRVHGGMVFAHLRQSTRDFMQALELVYG
jgi:hypothetical protein